MPLPCTPCPQSTSHIHSRWMLWIWICEDGSFQVKSCVKCLFYYLAPLWAKSSLRCLSVSSTSALPTALMFQNNRQKSVCQKYLWPAWWVTRINTKKLFLNSEPCLVKDKVRRGVMERVRESDTTSVRNGDRRGRDRGYESFISLILLTTPQLGFIFSLWRWDTQRPVRTAAFTWEGKKNESVTTQRLGMSFSQNRKLPSDCHHGDL